MPHSAGQYSSGSRPRRDAFATSVLVPGLGIPVRVDIIHAMRDCLFCKIVRGEIPCRKIYEDGELLAFHDIAPQAPVHFLVIPKRHIASILEFGDSDAELAGRLVLKARELAHSLGCSEKGARFVFNCKADGGQTVDHVHLHVLGGRRMAWPPG